MGSPPGACAVNPLTTSFRRACASCFIARSTAPLSLAEVLESNSRARAQSPLREIAIAELRVRRELRDTVVAVDDAGVVGRHEGAHERASREAAQLPAVGERAPRLLLAADLERLAETARRTGVEGGSAQPTIANKEKLLVLRRAGHEQHLRGTDRASAGAVAARSSAGPKTSDWVSWPAQERRGNLTIQ